METQKTMNRKPLLIQDGAMEVSPDEIQTFPARLYKNGTSFLLSVPVDIGRFLCGDKSQIVVQAAIRKMATREGISLFPLLRGRHFRIWVLCPKCHRMGALTKMVANNFLVHHGTYKNGTHCYVSKTNYPESFRHCSRLVCKYRRQIIT